jgi:hypothetical protein
MRRLMMPLCLLLSACSFHSQAVSAVDSVAGLRREIAELSRSSWRYSAGVVKAPAGQVGCAALLAQMYQDVDDCNVEIREVEREGGMCEPGRNGQPSENCPKCEQLISTKQQWASEGCDPSKVRP